MTTMEPNVVVDMKSQKISQIETWNEADQVPKEDIDWMLGELKRAQEAEMSQAQTKKTLVTQIEQLEKTNKVMREVLTHWLAFRGSMGSVEVFQATTSIASATVTVLNAKPQS